MQTRTYGELIDLIQSLIGAGTMLGDEYLKIANFIDRRLAEAYNASPSWARYIVGSEERILYGILSSGLTGDDAHSNSYYYFLGNDSNGNAVYKSRNTHSTNHFLFYYVISNNKWRLGKIPTSDLTVDSSGVVTYTNITTLSIADDANASSPLEVSSWTNQGGVAGTLSLDSRCIVLYDDAEGNDINEFIRIHQSKAFLKRSQIEYDFFLDADGAHLLNAQGTDVNKVFVTYKKRLELLTSQLTLTSPVDATDFVGSAGNAPANRALTVPLEFFYFVAHAAYADFIRLEGKRDEAQVEEAVAQNYLAIELEKIDIRNNNNSINHKFSTYVNRQSR